MKRVILFSSQGLFRNGLRRLIGEATHIEIAATAAEAEKLARSDPSPIVLFDRTGLAEPDQEAELAAIMARLLAIPDIKIITVQLDAPTMQVYRFQHIANMSLDDLIHAIDT